jgi:hypothetical protein
MGQSRNLEQRSQELQATFEELLESRNVYYNPPESVEMHYDAIVFKRSSINNRFANDSVYMQSHFYTVTTITIDPDAPIIDKISKLPNCVFEASYVADNLYHNRFRIH